MRRVALPRLMQLPTLAVLTLLVGCLPTRRDNAPAPDVVAVDTQAASDASDGAEQDADDDAGTEDVPVDTHLPEGCKEDSQCSALVDDPCHTAVCDKTTGLCKAAIATNGTDCSTGSKCFTNQVCKGGHCIGKAVDCDDDDICTTDLCNKDVGCINSENEAPCNDGDFCTEKDKCTDGKCGGKAVQCLPAKDACSESNCESKLGCVIRPVEASAAATVTCDDGDGCTEKDKCAKGTCVGTIKNCADDGDPCTIEMCTTLGKESKCRPAGIPGLACDDKNPCTQMDRCVSKDGGPINFECKGYVLTCDDKNACTDDSCADGKCVNKPRVGVCNDSDVCTTADHCESGKCVGSKPNCDDGNLCTDDKCDAKAGGCIGLPSGATCSDGDACTSGDSCEKTVCAGTKNACDDGKICTKDACDPASGCSYEMVKNGSTCVGGGQCWGGACVVAKCSNTICEFSETTSNCPADCPAGGGLCKVDDAKCIASCQTSNCAAEDKACAADASCTGLAACVDKCSDNACRLGCIQKATPASVVAYYARGYCLSTKCMKNAWNGKQCKSSQPGYATCIGACQSGVCPEEETTCYGSPDCKKIADCVDKCSLSDSACPVVCIKAGTTKAASQYDKLAVCVQSKCL
ncbi:MAG: hypothetical protein KC502_18470 [Myxococcales bacterium]|nr:hypothetical protein [Myxococcales bacterium]